MNFDSTDVGLSRQKCNEAIINVFFKLNISKESKYSLKNVSDEESHQEKKSNGPFQNLKGVVIEIKNSQEEGNGRLEMREESASEFEDRSIVMIHSEEQKGKD